MGSRPVHSLGRALIFDLYKLTKSFGGSESIMHVLALGQ